MKYSVIAEELMKYGFSKNNYGSPEATIENYNIAFVEHPFYHVIVYSRKNDSNRTLYVPGDIKLPKACDINDVLFVIESLVKGESEDKIILEIYERLHRL